MTRRTICLTLLLAAMGCAEQTNEHPPVTIHYDAQLSYYTIRTITHEGHRYVVLRTGNDGVAMVVHPDDAKAEKESK